MHIASTHNLNFFFLQPFAKQRKPSRNYEAFDSSATPQRSTEYQAHAKLSNPSFQNAWGRIFQWKSKPTNHSLIGSISRVFQGNMESIRTSLLASSCNSLRIATCTTMSGTLSQGDMIGLRRCTIAGRDRRPKHMYLRSPAQVVSSIQTFTV